MHQNRQAGKKEVPDNRLLIVSCKYFVHKTFNRKSCKKLEKKKENHAGIVTSNHLLEIAGLQQKISIRPIRNDKFTNKMRLLMQFLCWLMPRKMLR